MLGTKLSKRCEDGAELAAKVPRNCGLAQPLLRGICSLCSCVNLSTDNLNGGLFAVQAKQELIFQTRGSFIAQTNPPYNFSLFTFHLTLESHKAYIHRQDLLAVLVSPGTRPMPSDRKADGAGHYHCARNRPRSYTPASA